MWTAAPPVLQVTTALLRVWTNPLDPVPLVSTVPLTFLQ